MQNVEMAMAMAYRPKIINKNNRPSRKRNGPSAGAHAEAVLELPMPTGQDRHGLINRQSGDCSAPLGPRGILVLDLANRISGLAKGNQHSLGEVDTFFVTFRDLVPRLAVPRTGMINESGFDGVCYDDKAVFWHSGSLLLSAITDCPNLKMRTFRDWVVGQFEKTARWVALVGHARVPLTQPLLPSSHDCPVE